LVIGGLLLIVATYEGWSFWKSSELQSERKAAIEAVARMMEKCGWGYDLSRAESFVVQVHLQENATWPESADLFRVSTACGAEGR